MRSHLTVDIVHLHGDVALSEAVASDCQVLAATGEARVLVDIKDNRDGSSVVAGGVVEVAVFGVSIEDMSLASLPHHGEGVVLGDG